MSSSERKQPDLDIIFTTKTMEKGEIRYGPLFLGNLTGDRWSQKAGCYRSWLLNFGQTYEDSDFQGYRFTNLRNAASFAFAVYVVTDRVTVNIKTTSGQLLDTTKG